MRLINTLIATSNGGDASRVGKRCSYLFRRVCFHLSLFPTRDASPPLVLAFGGSVWCLRLVIAFIAEWHHQEAQNATSNGGDASRVGKDAATFLAELVFSPFSIPDAGRVAPIRGRVWCLRYVLAFGACVWCLRLVLETVCIFTFYQTAIIAIK